MLRHDGKYYMTYSANDYQSPWYGVGYATTTDIRRGWTKYRSNPIVQNVEGLFGTGHHSFFTDKEGRLRIVFHAHHSSGTIHPRMMYIGTMDFSDDGVLGITADSLIRPKVKDDTSIKALPLTGEREEGLLYDTAGRRLTPDAASRGKGIRIKKNRKEIGKS